MGGRPRHRRVPGERGAAAVEFALVVVPLLMILFGIISFGYMLSFRQAISQGAAEGARAAAVAPAGSNHAALATAAINESLSGYQGIRCGTTVVCTVTVGSCGSSPAYATVTVDYDYEARPLTPALPGLGIVMPDHLAYTSKVEVSC